MQLHIRPEALQVMKRAAEDDFPNETCGFMYGEEGDPRVVSLARAVINAREGDQRRRFEISPLDYMQAERFALQEGLSLLGVYHSHPDHPAQPSEHDRVQAMPVFSYVILSVMAGQVADLTSWRLNDEQQFEAETVLGVDFQKPQSDTAT